MELVVFLFVVGYLLQHFGMFLQIMKMEKLRSAEAVSVDTLILFVFSTFSRFIWIRDTILIETNFTYFELFIGFIVIFYTLYLTLKKYNYENSIFELLNNKLIPIFLRWYVILAIAVVLSYFVFPGNEGQKFDIQMLVSFTIFTEAVNLFPQIFYLRAKRDSHDISDVYNFLMLISRCFRLVFWLKLYFDSESIEFLIFADLVNLIVVGGYVYNSFLMKDGFKLPTEKNNNKIY